MSQRRLSTLTIITLIIISSFTSNYVNVKADAAWLSGWSKRIKITVDFTLIDADLTQFPLLIYLSSSSGKTDVDVTRIFSDLGANSLKIAVTKSDGTTEIYVEVEKWDNANSKAWLWVSKSDWVVADAADTIIYLYWDATHADNTSYVGATNSVPAENVWDSYYVWVGHVGASSAPDSTTSDNDGSYNGSPATEAGVTGLGLTFDESDDYISFASDASFDYTNDWTIQMWAKTSDTTAQKTMFRQVSATYGFVTGYLNYPSTGQATLFYGSSTAANSLASVSTGLNDGAYRLYTFTKSGTTIAININGTSDNTRTRVAATSTAATFTHGYHTTSTRMYQGSMDEFRVSIGIARSAAYNKATYNNEKDALVTYDVLEASFSASKGFTVGSSTSKIAELIRTASKTVTITSSTLREIMISFTVSLSAAVTQTVTRTLESIRDTTQGITLSSASQRLNEFYRDVAQAVTHASSAIRVFLAGPVTYLRGASQSITVGSAVNVYREVSRIASLTLPFNVAGILGSVEYMVYAAVAFTFTRLLGVQVPSGSQLPPPGTGYTNSLFLFIIPIALLLILIIKRREE